MWEMGEGNTILMCRSQIIWMSKSDVNFPFFSSVPNLINIFFLNIDSSKQAKMLLNEVQYIIFNLKQKLN